MNNIIYRFKKVVAKFGYKTALESDLEGKMTYEELDKYSNYIACQIIARYPNAKRIGVCIDRSFAMISAMLAIMKVNAAYVPLDLYCGRKRLDYYVNDANIGCVICKNSMQFENEILLEDKYKFSEFRIDKLDENSLAYIIYTSGSTGTPKGVMVKHDSIMNTLNWRIEYYALSENDIVLQIPAFSFSSSVEDIFSTLLSGGKLVLIEQRSLLYPKKILHSLEKYKVTHFLMVPTLYKHLLQYNQIQNVSSLKFVVVAGEMLNTDLIKAHYEKIPEVMLFNEYGMSETSVGCSVAEVKKDTPGNCIGHPIKNMHFIVENIENDGVGELTIAGIGVAEGYVHEMLGEGRFQISKWGWSFRSGDYVQYTEKGYIYKGRKDNQIKIHGQRLDLSEIESVIEKVQNVEDSRALVIKGEAYDYLGCVIKGVDVSMDMIMETLKSNLPSYYIPKAFKIVEEFPKLSNGKIDYVSMRKFFATNQ